MTRGTDLYVDTSVLIALLVDDPHSARARDLTASAAVAASTWTLAEVTSALNLAVRTGRLSRKDADAAETARERWTEHATLHPLIDGDIAEAHRLLRRTETALRTPDAVHLALAARIREPLATFDTALAAAAREAGLPLAVS